MNCNNEDQLEEQELDQRKGRQELMTKGKGRCG